jgi:hypothetical protein
VTRVRLSKWSHILAGARKNNNNQLQSNEEICFGYAKLPKIEDAQVRKFGGKMNIT